MVELMKKLQPLQSEYVDRRFDGTKEEYFKQLELSSTLYIGNLSFYTSEDQIYELFGKVGVVQRVIMGLDRNTKTPCGFCFVIYHTRAHALAAVRFLNGSKLDNRQLRVDIDYGFEEGRQFGRGRSGGQVRDEFRTDYDADRGGFGKVVAQQLASEQLSMWQEVQAGALLGAGVLPAAAGGAVFFGQGQRDLQHKAGGHADADGAAGGEGESLEIEEVAGGVEADEGGHFAAVNPRMAGRGHDRDDEDEEDEQDGHRAKRRRVAGAGDDDAAVAGAGATAGDGSIGKGDSDMEQEQQDGSEQQADDDSEQRDLDSEQPDLASE